MSGTPATLKPTWSVTLITFNSRARLFCIDACLSVHQLPDIQDDQSDWEPDGPWWVWLDQVECYQTTHSGWHKLWELSVLEGRGPWGLQSHFWVIFSSGERQIHLFTTGWLRQRSQRGKEKEWLVQCTERMKDMAIEDGREGDKERERQTDMRSFGG